MLPTHRLFSIIQHLRAARRPVKAQQLADELQVSVRTIYRDIAELQNQHVPIEGEAGIGYVLRAGYDMPPLMLTANELEAAYLGAQWLSQRGDPIMTRAADSLLSKIQSALPEHLKALLLKAAVAVPVTVKAVDDTIDTSAIREAIRRQKIVLIHYQDSNGNLSTRRIWPFIIAYFDTVRVVTAWCELREGYRHFRTDRINKITVTEEDLPRSRHDLKREWMESVMACEDISCA